MHEKQVLRPKASSLTHVSYSDQYTKIHPQNRLGKLWVNVFAQNFTGQKRTSLIRGYPRIFWLDFAFFSSPLVLFPAYKISVT